MNCSSLGVYLTYVVFDDCKGVRIKIELVAEISTVLEFALHTALPSSTQKWQQWHRDLVGAHCSDPYRVSQLSQSCHYSPPLTQEAGCWSPTHASVWPTFPKLKSYSALLSRNTFPTSSNNVRLSDAMLEQITSELQIVTLAIALS